MHAVRRRRRSCRMHRRYPLKRPRCGRFHSFTQHGLHVRRICTRSVGRGTTEFWEQPKQVPRTILWRQRFKEDRQAFLRPQQGSVRGIRSPLGQNVCPDPRRSLRSRHGQDVRPGLRILIRGFRTCGFRTRGFCTRGFRTRALPRRMFTRFRGRCNRRQNSGRLFLVSVRVRKIETWITFVVHGGSYSTQTSSPDVVRVPERFEAVARCLPQPS